MDREIIEYNIPELLFNMKSTTSAVKDKRRGNHSHGAVELVHVNKGMIYCDIDNEMLELFEGETILINSYVIHRLRSDKDFDITYIQIDLSNLNIHETGADCSIYEYINLRNTLPYIVSQGGELTNIFQSLKSEAKKKSKGYQLYMTGCFYHLAAFMSRNNLSTGRKKYSQAAINRIIPVARHIEINYAVPLNLDSLSKLIPCDRYALCKYFKNATGGTVIDYLNFVRLKKAYDLLTNTDKTILEISLECGFASTQYFNRIFKQNTGCAPSKYRNAKYESI